MSHDDDHRSIFDVRAVNLTKLHNPIDLEIIVAECDKALGDIKRQIMDGFGDSRWLKDANRAKADIEFKRGLASKKLAVQIETKAAAAANPEANFRTRFHRAAEEALAPGVFLMLVERAKASA